MKIIWSKIAGFARNYLVPNFLVGKEKAVAAFAAPIILAQLARLWPSMHVDPSIAVTLGTSVLLSLTTHQVTNT